MAKTIADVVTEARQMLQDAREPFRHTQVYLVSLMNTAFLEVYRERPDAYMGCCGDDIEVPSYTEGDLTANPVPPFPIDERLFFQAVVYHIVANAQLQDDEFAVDGRAVTLIQTFRTMLGMG